MNNLGTEIKFEIDLDLLFSLLLQKIKRKKLKAKMVTNFKEMYLIDKYLMNKLENIYNESGRPLPFNFKKSQNDEQVKSNDIFGNDFNVNVNVNEQEQGSKFGNLK